ncbi:MULTISPECIES: YycH family regulatory protein [Bacillaceae]|uniref:Regulatory protein YycH domain-containing protein n=1 Tax=Evansella alkalicola TaxID=745819 RepID=A0ABS6JUT7_9BACI|nr:MULTISPECIES: two-component system activity regulator YycH [Bacillaceae]MBU9722327.1 hypothetical protein [Bacillus alkalicola]
MRIFELIKTVTLWVLVLTSIYLTYLIWTYQPEYRILESSENFIESAQIGEERPLSSFLIPSKVVIHEDEEKLWLSPMEKAYETLMEAIREIEIDQLISTYTRPPSPENKYQGIELVFSQKLDSGWLDRLIDMNDYELPLETVDRIILYINENSVSSDVIIRFISLEEERMYQANTNLSKEQLKSLYNYHEENMLTTVKAVDLGQVRESAFRNVRYFPNELFSMVGYTYLSESSIDPESFKQVLFGDPEFVKHYFQGNDEIYIDGSRFMSVEENKNILKYNHPTNDRPLTTPEGHVVTDSIDFINSHAGWTGEYQLDSWNHLYMYDQNDHVQFRMSVKGVPVLASNINREQYFTVSLTRTGNQITEYIRPLNQLVERENEPIPLNFTLFSYDRIMELIDESDTIALEAIEDIRIGFYMNKSPSVITFEPAWFVKDRGSWKRIARVSEGGIIGLE